MRLRERLPLFDKPIEKPTRKGKSVGFLVHKGIASIDGFSMSPGKIPPPEKDDEEDEEEEKEDDEDEEGEDNDDNKDDDDSGGGGDKDIEEYEFEYKICIDKTKTD